MNPNAPEHQPSTARARDIAIIRIASEKMFSAPDESSSVQLNKRMDETLSLPACVDESGVLVRDKVLDLKAKVRANNEGKEKKQKLPEFPFFSATPTAEESNVCTGIRLNSREGLRVLNPDAGTPALCTESSMQYICDYANRWHSTLHNTDYRSAGTDPKFYFLPNHHSFHTQLTTLTPEKMAAETEKKLSRRQFWKLRYLFVAIHFVPSLQEDAHVAFCAVSPEAKTVDYVCSGGDNGLPNSPRSAGSKCVPHIFAWLAAYMGDSFVAYEWRLRTSAGQIQIRSRGDCAVYTVTHAQCLAFGYGLESSFPLDHQDKMLARRRRYVQDLMNQGFAESEPGGENTQYYPLLDRKPTAKRSEGWMELPKFVMDKLPAAVANKNVCYAGCTSKALLVLHCQRNARFYPGYTNLCVSGSGVTLEEFVLWVEQMDAWRHGKKQVPKEKKPLPYPLHQPFHW